MADYKKLQEAENINLEAPNTFADQLDAAIAKTNKPYQYDFNTDQLYQDYKKNYMTEAQKAKNNVINAGKTLTAGYPDTYVDSAANQQYQTYLAEINRLAPAFENLAYSQHLMENEDALKQAAMLADLSNDEYARYRDLVGDAQNNRKYELNNYKYDLGYEAEASKLGDALDTANKAYEQKLYLDKIQEAEKAKAEAEAAARAAASRGGSGGGWGGYGGGYDYGAYNNGLGTLVQNSTNALVQGAMNSVAQSVANNMVNNRTFAIQQQNGLPVYTRGTYNSMGLAIPADPAIVAKNLKKQDKNIASYR